MMQVSCPNCSANYNVKDALFADKARRLKCVKCQHVWAPAAGKLGAAPEKPEEFVIKASEKAHTTTKQVPHSRKFSKKWLVFLTIVVLFFGSTILLRSTIVKFWPASAKYYDLIQMPVDVLGTGLEFSEIQANRILDNDRLVLLMKGKITNTSHKTRHVPPFIQAISLNNKNKPIEKWQFEAPSASLKPGESIDFKTVLKDINGFASNLVIRFTQAQNIKSAVDDRQTHLSQDEKTVRVKESSVKAKESEH